jgi:hypothetical protein
LPEVREELVREKLFGKYLAVNKLTGTKLCRKNMTGKTVSVELSGENILKTTSQLFSLKKLLLQTFVKSNSNIHSFCIVMGEFYYNMLLAYRRLT